jgi:hypothetical protein
MQVEAVEVLRAEAFEEHEVWLDAPGMTEGYLQDQLNKTRMLLVPATFLRATDAEQDGPRAAGVLVL